MSLSLWFVGGAQNRNYPNVWNGEDRRVKLTLANSDSSNPLLVSMPRGAAWDAYESSRVYSDIHPGTCHPESNLRGPRNFPGIAVTLT